MKSLIIVLILLLFVSCDNDDLTKVNNDGTGGISCLLNGELLRPSGGGFYGNSTARIDTYPDGTDFIILSLSNRQEKFNGLAFLTLLIYDVNIDDLEGRIFELKDKNTPESYGQLRLTDFDNNYQTNSNITGELKVTNFDKNEWIISGTFWFNAENENGDTIKVTDGRFDMHL